MFLRPGIRGLLRLPLHRPDVASDEMDEEIRSHLELRVAQLIAQGFSPEAAAAEAERRFGSAEIRRSLRAAARHRTEVMSLRERMEALRHDLRYALRQLRNTPAMTLMIVLTFALGIGANATMFGIVDRLLLRPPAHVAQPDRIFTLHLLAAPHRKPPMLGPAATLVPGEGLVQKSWSYPDYQAMLANVRAFEGVAAESYTSEYPLGRGTSARTINGVLVSGSFFPTLGVRLLLGRGIQPADEAPSTAADVIVISERVWRRDFGASRGAIGQTVELGTGRFTIVGVAPAGFNGLDHERIDVWIPLLAPHAPPFPLPQWTTARNVQLLTVFGRVRPPLTIAAAEARATSVVRSDAAAHAESDSLARVRLEPVIPARASHVTPAARVALLLGLVSTLVLLIACANVANLLLTRTLRRRRELAVRLALGISRGRLGAQLAMEVMAMALLGGCAALGIVAWDGRIIQRVLLTDYAWPDAPFDARLLAYAALATIVVGLLASLVPAMHGVPADLSLELRSGTRGGVSRTRLRTALLLTQATLSVVLLSCAGVFVRSFRNATSIDLGIDIDRVLVATVDLPGAGFSKSAMDASYQQMLERLSTSPGIAHATVAEGAPFQSTIQEPVSLPGQDTVPALGGRSVRVVAATRDYFATSGTQMLHGRDFSNRSDGEATRVAVVNDELARLLWPSGDPLGRCIKIGGPKEACSEVIGVAAATRTLHTDGAKVDPQAYVPLTQGIHLAAARALLIRPAGNSPELALRRIQQMLQTTAPNLPYVNVVPMRTLLAEDIQPWRLGATMFALFGLLALVLAAVGLYGVTSYMVGQRMHELGVRVALGALPRQVIALVVGQGLAIVSIGSVLGVAISLGVARFIESLLFQVSARDPLVLALVAATMILVSLAATIVPAGRAARADPLCALRDE
ncbi:MAG: ADOP family duplicated permease [Gemmatimonadota bacterium]|nr:ADOP family duplicated permease [Gemmatimonadota bacterium]